MDTQLPYPSLYVPALQAGLYTEPYAWSCEHGSGENGSPIVSGKSIWDVLSWAHTHGIQLPQAESRQAWVLFSMDCAVPTGLPCARKHLTCTHGRVEHFGACLLRESHVLGREAQVSERSVQWDLTQSNMSWLHTVHYLIFRIAWQSLNHWL